MPSKLFRQILIATDGSKYTKTAVDYAIDLAGSTVAKLYIIYVIDTAAYGSIPPVSPDGIRIFSFETGG